MAVKTYKPTSPSRRGMTGHSFEEVTETRPERSLLSPLRKKAGRNARGVVTVRHRGGGHKRRYRRIDFMRDKVGIPAKVQSVQYDPNRSARIALLAYADGEKRYIIAPLGVRPDDMLMSGPSAGSLVGLPHMASPTDSAHRGPSDPAARPDGCARECGCPGTWAPLA